jgi:hypothetical protein
MPNGPEVSLSLAPDTDLACRRQKFRIRLGSQHVFGFPQLADLSHAPRGAVQAVSLNASIAQQLQLVAVRMDKLPLRSQSIK